MDFKTKIGLSTGKIKPEFGNMDHIKFLKERAEVERRLRKGISPYFNEEITDDEDPFVNYLLTMSIECVCGGTVKVDYYTSLEDEFDVFDDCDFWCNHCNRDYHCEVINDVVTVTLG